MVKSTNSTATDSTIGPVKRQANSTSELLVKAEVYSSLRNLTKFDALVFKKIANNIFPGARKTMSDWDAFKAEYQK